MAAKLKSSILALVLLMCCSSGSFAEEKVYIFAAASTTNVVKELISNYQKESATSAKYLTSFASSSTLARQIEAGADANIFISANVKWYQWLAERDLIAPGSDSIMAANALVVIAAPENKKQISDIKQLPEVLGEGYLAMGDYNHVPAGMYAKEALDYYQIWNNLKMHTAQYPTVRVALNAVDTSQADLGIVYKTDALQAKSAHIVYTFAPESHTPIKYPICAIKGKTSAETEKFLTFMKSSSAQKILEKYGFVTQ